VLIAKFTYLNYKGEKRISNKKIFLIAVSVFIFLSGATTGSVEKKPIYGNINLEIEKLQEINDLNSKGKFFFTFIRDMAVDIEGNLYVLDRNDIMLFKADAKFVGTIAARGEGPGEYKWVNSISTDLENNLVILDYHKILLFDKNRKYNETIKIDFRLTDKVYIDQKGYLYGIIREITGIRSNKVLIKFDKKGSIIKKLARYTDEATEIRIGKTGGGVMGGNNHPYMPDTLTCRIFSTGVCVVKNTSDKLIIFPFKGQKTRSIKMNLKPEPISSDEMEIYRQRYKQNLKNIVFPPHRPFWHRLLGDEKGRIYAVRKKSIAEKKAGYSIDIFSKDGKYLYKAHSPFMPFLIWKGKLYTIAADKEHNLSIKIYRIKNYRELKQYYR
jgi:hypothetical protein